MLARFPRNRRQLVLRSLRILAVGWLLLTGCGERPVPSAPSAASRPVVPPVPEPEPTRGLVLISVDTLRADHLGVYGHESDTSPQLDELAQRGVIFDLAFAHAPSTLISHMSVFTSLLPPEHGVKPPQWNVLSPDIPTLPEALRSAGFRTAGFTEGGYMEGDHGFARGFDLWQDPGFESSTDVEATFDRGLEFLHSVAHDDQPFFLFLHTYSVHDPYEPPPEFRHRHWQGEPPTAAPADASTLEAVNAGRREMSEREAFYYASRYDDGIRYFDGVFGRFLEELETLGLRDEITLVLMSDHGEEFLDHGRMLHTQVYPELLRVPLVVVHPGLTHRRVARPVALVDLAPTMLDLMGLDAAASTALPGASGRSLVPELVGRPDPAQSPPVYAEVEFVDGQRSLISVVASEAEEAGSEEAEAAIWQLVERRPKRDPDGAWISRSVEFDVAARRVGLRLASFQQPRNLKVEWIGSESTTTLEERVLPPEWTELVLRVPGDGPGRLRLSVDECLVPKDLGLGDDPRCLGFMLAEPEPIRRDLIRLRVGADGRLVASADLSRHPAHEDVLENLRRRLETLPLRRLADPSGLEYGSEERKALEALGYL